MAQRLPFPGLMRCLCFFIPGEVEGCRKLSCSNREGTVGTTALSPYLKWQSGCLIHSWKSLCFLSISWCLTANSQRPATQHSISEPLSCTAVTFIRKPHFAAYPCPVSEQTYGLIPCKTLSDLPPTPAATPWFFLGRGSYRTAVASVSLQGWAAGINVFVLSKCAALESQFRLQNAEISIRQSANQSVLLTWLVTAANMGNHLPISSSL